MITDSTNCEDDTLATSLRDTHEDVELTANIETNLGGNVDDPISINVDSPQPSNVDNPSSSNLENPPTSNFDYPSTSNVDYPSTSNIDSSPTSMIGPCTHSNKIYVYSTIMVALSPLLLAIFMGIKSSVGFFEPLTASSPTSSLTFEPSLSPTIFPTLSPVFPNMGFDIDLIQEPASYGLYNFSEFNETENKADASIYYLVSGGRKVFTEINDVDCLTDISDEILVATDIVGPIAKDQVRVFHGVFFYMNYTEARRSHIWNAAERLIKFCVRLDITCLSCDLNGDGVLSSAADSVSFHNTIISWKVSNDTVNEYNMND
mmetsp:Transcript_23161/g.26624  ORF Transcript_23161/g.26624 Transcript_23161/m.26624 type:complete len:318 (-) Transcript_23161:98-1051(-)